MQAKDQYSTSTKMPTFTGKPKKINYDQGNTIGQYSALKDIHPYPDVEGELDSQYRGIPKSRPVTSESRTLWNDNLDFRNKPYLSPAVDLERFNRNQSYQMPAFRGAYASGETSRPRTVRDALGDFISTPAGKGAAVGSVLGIPIVGGAVGAGLQALNAPRQYISDAINPAPRMPAQPERGYDQIENARLNRGFPYEMMSAPGPQAPKFPTPYPGYDFRDAETLGRKYRIPGMSISTAPTAAYQPTSQMPSYTGGMRDLY